VLIYPEESMWWNYRKPKPLKIGGFKFAAQNQVPILPTFITMRETEDFDNEGYPIQAYTLHILKPIYPDPLLSAKENQIRMLEENFSAWKETYEKVYGIPLTYTTKKGE
jgi:1-acyl-sn-glycerol-3-phosphate acyltransferase